MSRLTEALDEYITQKKKNATLLGFINHDKENANIITDWMSSYAYYDEAKNGLNRAFQTRFKKHYPNKRTKKAANIDISVQFEDSQATKDITKDGTKILSKSAKQAANRLKIRMVCKQPSSSTQGELSALSMPPTPPTPTPPQPTYMLDNNVEVVEPLKKYINFCKQKSESEGFFVKSDTHQLL
ncbi:hypothetical protein [Parasitella parasitica]|uniref:Uncharacterized protein n=1 Tax=Parasitella parasitica TaxID=35722 RepID=A0A0B7N9V1_9FUNG|nr:hypothetical protein [Parasitella parasitica]